MSKVEDQLLLDDSMNKLNSNNTDKVSISANDNINNRVITTIRIQTQNGILIKEFDPQRGISSDEIIAKVKIPYDYFLVEITLNGISVTTDNIPKTLGTKDQNLIYIIKEKPEYKVSTKIITDNNLILEEENIIAIGYSDEALDIEVLEIPESKKYYLDKIRINEEEFNFTDIDTLKEVMPKAIGHSDILITYIVKEYVNTVIKVENENGEIIKGIISELGKQNQKLESSVKNSEEFSILKILLNGKEIENVPTTLGEVNQEIIYVVELVKTTVSLQVICGEIILDSNKVTGEFGEVVEIEDFIIDDYSDYRLATITKNNEIVSNNDDLIPISFGTDDINIIYNLTKIIRHKATQVVKVKESEMIIEETVFESEENTELQIFPFELSDNLKEIYYLDSVYLNNDKISNLDENNEVIYDLPKVLSDDFDITYLLDEFVTLTIKGIGEDGEMILEPIVKKGKKNSELEEVTLNILDGYEIANMTLNDVEVCEIPKWFGSSNQKFVYSLKRVESQIYLSVICNEDILKTENVTGLYEDEVNLDSFDIADYEGYTLDDITVNEIIMSEDEEIIPKTFGIYDLNIKYILNKIPVHKVITKMICDDGNILIEENDVFSGYEGQEVNIEVLDIPKNYEDEFYLSSVEINGYSISKIINDTIEFSLPREIPKKDLEIVYITKRYVTTNILIQDIDGNEIEKVLTQTGKQNSELAGSGFIPTGYELVNLTLNDEDIENEPTTLGAKNQDIIYIVRKIKSRFTMRVLCENEIFRDICITGEWEEELNLVPFDIIDYRGYKLKDIIIDGESFGTKLVEIPNEFGLRDREFIYELQAINHNAIAFEMLDTNGDYIMNRENIITGYIGERVRVKPLKAPDDCYIIAVLENNKVISEDINGKIDYTLPSKIAEEDILITYVVKKYVVTISRILDEKGNLLAQPIGQRGRTGRALTQDAIIPSGYELTKILVDGKEVIRAPKEFGNKDQNITYIVKKLPSVTNTRVITKAGNVFEAISEIGYEGETFSKIVKIPEGYRIDKILVNNESVNIRPNYFGKEIQNIDYVITEIIVQTDIKVIDTNNKIIYETTLRGLIDDNLDERIIIKSGYEILQILVDGEDVKKPPMLFNTKNQEIIYLIKNLYTTDVTTIKYQKNDSCDKGDIIISADKDRNSIIELSEYKKDIKNDVLEEVDSSSKTENELSELLLKLANRK